MVPVKETIKPWPLYDLFSFDIGWPDAVTAETVGPALLPTQKTVLVVDDDPGLLRGIRRLLKQHGYDSALFSSADALNKHHDFEHAICIVLDINLGDCSGLELSEQLKAAGIFLPVIFITGNDSRTTRAAAMEAGCIAYLTKPFAARSLIEPIERLSAGLA